jgi:hypothetical protein
MLCPHCKEPVKATREFCPHCGQRVKVAFAAVAASMQAEAAVRRGRRAERNLTGALALLVLAGVVILGLNQLWDTRLAYEGADVPAISAPAPTEGETPLIPLPDRYLDCFRLSVPPGRAARVMGYRFPPIRDQLRRANGAGDALGKAIQAGLKYLAQRQAADGAWPNLQLNATFASDLRILKEHDESSAYQWARTGVTALALLAFLGEGETWLPDARGQRGPFADRAQKAIAALVQGQDQTNGRFGPAQGNFMYNHGLATLAIAEAAGMSGDPYLLAAAQKGLDLIERTQGPQGGWDYKDQITGRQDASVSSWQVQALCAGIEAGLQVKPEVLRKALSFYQTVTDVSTGLVQYDLSDKQAFASLSGVALMLRRLLGEGPDAPGMRALARKAGEATTRVERNWGRDWDERRSDVDQPRRARVFDPYAWYHSAYGLYFQGDEASVKWVTSAIAALIELQDRDGAWRGNDKWSVKAGAVYSTALCVLALQVYSRIH